MAQSHAWGAVLSGVRATIIGVEVDIAAGLPSIGVIGLAHTAVGEARWRIRSAFGVAGIPWPMCRVTVSLTPADLPKRGAGLDLAIAVGLLRAADHVPSDGGGIFLGELGLDGTIRHIPGTIAAAVAARAQGIDTVTVPVSAAAEASAIPDIQVIAVRDLDHLRAVLRGEESGAAWPGESTSTTSLVPDLSDVRGHQLGRFGLEVAAAGAHHMGLLGPPGVGKTLLAERLPGVLPDLDIDDAIEATTIASLAGLLPAGSSLVRRPPFQSPHHSASPTALLGTIRSQLVLPGAVTLAHGGVLFLDEAPEFARPSLEGLRQPLESGTLSIARAGAMATVPARIQLILAANPCPCGLGVDRGEQCTCTPMAKRRYRARLSGPLLDRIDVRLTLAPPARGDRPGECSTVVAARVATARHRAAHRFIHQPWSVNARIPTGALRGDYSPDPAGCALLEDQEAMSARGVDRVARMAWTICDLRGGDRVTRDDVATALVLRGGADDDVA